LKDKGKYMPQELISKVWLMHGTFGGATPGVLTADGGKASFITAEGEHFNVPVSDIKDVKWPFLQFGLGFNASVNGQKYKFTFMKPNGAADLDDSTLGQVVRFTRLGRGVDSISTLAGMGESKKMAKQWKDLLK
jgi:hypothetical protein